MQEGIQNSKYISLLYADNLVISAEHEETIEKMLEEVREQYSLCMVNNLLYTFSFRLHLENRLYQCYTNHQMCTYNAASSSTQLHGICVVIAW